MSTSLILLDGQNNYIEKPYISRFSGENSVIFSSGTIVNLNNSRKDNLFEPINLGEPIAMSEKGEFYLQIKFKPLTNQIDFCKILNDEELEESNKEIDSLLNIILPIARIYNETSFSAESFLNSSFVVDRESSEKPLIGYFEESKIYISSALVKSPDNILMEVFKNKTIDNISDDDIISLSFVGQLKYNFIDDSKFYKEFNFSSIELIKTNISSCNIDSRVHVGEINSNESFNFSFNYPIGLINKGDYVRLGSGNIKISIIEKEINYFKEEITLESGCKTSIYESKKLMSIIPEFS